MSRTITIAGGKKDVLLPNMLRYQGGAVVSLSDGEYSELSPTWKAANLSSDVPGGGLALATGTPTAGFALQNGTPTILTWTAPADGNPHRVSLVTNLHVTSLETGGAVTLNTTLPDSTAANPQVYAGGAAAAVYQFSQDRIVGSGTTVTLVQSSALTAGAAVLWAQLWGA